MAQGGQDLLSKLADRGEDVVGRISDMPGAQRLREAAGSLKERVDDLQKKMRGLDAVELDRQRHVRLDLDNGTPQELGLRVRQVPAAVRLRQGQKQVALRQ